MDISKAIQHIRPGAQWSLHGNDYDTLVWHGPGEKPTLQELQEAWDSIPPPPVIVSMTSLRLALIDAGLYQIVTSAINGIPDATEKLKAQIWWATAQNVRRDHPLVAGIAALAGRTDAQVDAIFAAAQALDNPTP